MDSLDRHDLAVAISQPPQLTTITHPMIKNSNILVRLSIGSVGSFEHVPTLADLSIEDVIL